jgi:ketosteroid isomerase-like protein
MNDIDNEKLRSTKNANKKSLGFIKRRQMIAGVATIVGLLTTQLPGLAGLPYGRDRRRSLDKAITRRLSGLELLEFQNLIKDYCAAWSTSTGQPNTEEIIRYNYPDDNDIRYYDFVEPKEGFDGFRGLFQGALENVYGGVSSFTWEAEPESIWASINGIVAITGFNWRITTVGPDQVVEGRMSIVWERRREGWKLVHEHMSLPISNTSNA